MDVCAPQGAPNQLVIKLIDYCAVWFLELIDCCAVWFPEFIDCFALWAIDGVLIGYLRYVFK